MQEDYEEFSPQEIKLLENYVTNTSSHIFCLRNLPEVIKGALFSRYSRSSLGLRALLLKEFILNEEEASFGSIVPTSVDETAENQMLALKKAQSFYDRILDGYGDDSIGELGGAHVAIENVSMLAAKLIEDRRIGGSPLEKSTRYIYFDQKVNGEYLFYREPILMTSAYRDAYVDTCNMLFETYSKLIPPLTDLMEAKFPKGDSISTGAYKASIRAKVLDCLRGLLPAGTLTNMGIYGNGRFFEHMIQRLHCNNLAELQDIGKRCHQELGKVIPSFVRRSHTEHRNQVGFAKFQEAMGSSIKLITEHNTGFKERTTEPGVRLISFDPDSPSKVAAGLLFEHSDKGLHELREYCRNLPKEEIASILDAGCMARENRRHKSPRALEHAEFTFEIIADFGAYRDLHRHRILTQERQLLTCDYGFYIPSELDEMSEKGAYIEAMERAKKVYDTIAEELPEEAQYIVPMAYNIRWYFHVNLRALQWICELRSAAAGHPTYRLIAQEMARQVSEAIPEFERFFKFVDYEGYDLGRLGQEQRKAEKAKRVSQKL
ncbi:MAG: Thymidylate synthase ThyX [Chlamydiae bacterium]|nr:Thymidylate synthase ThyX [Chlamydiota bacterium]